MCLIASFWLLLNPVTGKAEESKPAATKSPTADHVSTENFEYPELVVAPSASARLERETKNERASGFTRQVPLMASGLMTMVSGFMLNASTDPDEDKMAAAHGAGLAAIIVGGTWVATTTYMSLWYMPYSNGWREVKGMEGRDRRERLARERIAEEAINAPSRLVRRLNWLGLISNFAASGYMVATATDEMGRAFSAASVIAAVMPIVFPTRWQTTAETHEDYKKRIYGPVTNIFIPVDHKTGRSGLGLSLSLALN